MTHDGHSSWTEATAGNLDMFTRVVTTLSLLLALAINPYWFAGFAMLVMVVLAIQRGWHRALVSFLLRVSIWNWVALVILVLLGIAIILPNTIKCKCKSHTSEVMQNLYAISLSIERYALDNGGRYPLTLQPLIDEGYMPRYPWNPFASRIFESMGNGMYQDRVTGIVLTKEQREEAVRMKQVGFCPVHPAGNFVYLPWITTDADGSITVTGYDLAVFGRPRDSASKLMRHRNPPEFIDPNDGRYDSLDGVLLTLDSEGREVSYREVNHWDRLFFNSD